VPQSRRLYQVVFRPTRLADELYKVKVIPQQS